MEIRNEEHARKMLREWQELPPAAQKREIRLAIEHLELSSMYYAQKGNDKGVERADRCADIFTAYLRGLE
jgi:hypothetical protein